MSNRSTRRSDIAKYKRLTSNGVLITHLEQAGDAAGLAPLFAHAVQHWRVQISIRKPWCISCSRSFASSELWPAAFLLSTPGVSPIVSVSGICSQCWAGRDREDLRTCFEESSAGRALA
jgi:hypothetical protein